MALTLQILNGYYRNLVVVDLFSISENTLKFTFVKFATKKNWKRQSIRYAYSFV